MEESIQNNIAEIRKGLPGNVRLVCVSKFHHESMIRAAYQAGERDFGESRVQELVPKYESLPKDIRWHFIGHLQRNKVKDIVPFVHLIHSVDSEQLLDKINSEAEKIGRVVDVLLEVHVADEETKTGFSVDTLRDFWQTLRTYSSQSYWACYRNIRILGLMCMATNTDDENQIRKEFRKVKALADELFNPTTLPQCMQDYANDLPSFPIVSMGMTDDYRLAIEEGSNMVRIGSAIFGARNY